MGIPGLVFCPGRARAAELRRGGAGGRRVLAWLCCWVHPPHCARSLVGAGDEAGTEHLGPRLGGPCPALFDAARLCAHSSDLHGGLCPFSAITQKAMGKVFFSVLYDRNCRNK